MVKQEKAYIRRVITILSEIQVQTTEDKKYMWTTLA